MFHFPQKKLRVQAEGEKGVSQLGRESAGVDKFWLAGRREGPRTE
jgi:hypothetical protein